MLATEINLISFSAHGVKHIHILDVNNALIHAILLLLLFFRRGVKKTTHLLNVLLQLILVRCYTRIFLKWRYMPFMKPSQFERRVTVVAIFIILVVCFIADWLLAKTILFNFRIVQLNPWPEYFICSWVELLLERWESIYIIIYCF
jgi:hypothetical protein